MINPDGVYFSKRFYVEFALKFSTIYFSYPLTRKEAKDFSNVMSDFCCHNIGDLYLKLCDFVVTLDAKRLGLIPDDLDEGGNF